MRVTAVNAAAIAPRGDYVLYWMIAARRSSYSYALDTAIDHARALDRPLVVLEALRSGYRWASDRLHAFVLRGMADNAAAFARAGVTYLPYVERAHGAGKGLLAALAARACMVVTDEQPGFFLPRMVAAAGKQLRVRLEQVDGCGLLPLRATKRAWPTAAGFRRHLAAELPVHLLAPPHPRPLARLPRALRDGDVRGAVLRRWRMGHDVPLDALPIDHTVGVVRAVPGGSRAAARVLRAFLADRLPRYAEGRSHPDDDVASGLSPYLHFGHISAHEVADRARGNAAFLDELVTWRELGYAFCFHRADHARWSALPAWARTTLTEHARDPRVEHYTPRQLEAAATADPVWNAAQRQLLAEGRIHNYLRMVWGKKILEWSPSPKRALATMIHLNNKYALDGRDPNSYSGILWTLGLFDRPWGPVRPIFGTVRYMSSAAALRKLRMKRYLARWS